MHPIRYNKSLHHNIESTHFYRNFYRWLFIQMLWVMYSTSMVLLEQSWLQMSSCPRECVTASRLLTGGSLTIPSKSLGALKGSEPQQGLGSATAVRFCEMPWWDQRQMKDPFLSFDVASKVKSCGAVWHHTAHWDSVQHMKFPHLHCCRWFTQGYFKVVMTTWLLKRVAHYHLS